MSDARPEDGRDPEGTVPEPDGMPRGPVGRRAEELRAKAAAKQEQSEQSAREDPLGAAKSRTERAGDFGASKVDGAKAALGSGKDKLNAGIDKVAEGQGAAASAARGVKVAQKVAQVAHQVAETTKNIAASAKGLVVALGNPVSWIIIAVVLVLTFITLSVVTGIQVYGKNDSVDNCSANGSVSGGVEIPADATMEQNRDAMMAWLMKNNFKSNGNKPLTKEQAAAVAGNFAAESSFGFKVTEGHTMDGASNAEVDAWTRGGPRGLGMAQWTWNPGRAGTLIELAKSMNKNWFDPEVQFQMILNEMDGAYGPRLASAGFFASGGKPGPLAIIFHDIYEGSADDAAKKARRSAMAEEAYSNSKGGGYSSTGGDNCQQSGSSVGAQCFPVPGKGGFCYPMEPGVQAWNLNTYGGHAFEAKDIPGPEGTPMYAIMGGTVTKSGGDPPYGCHVSGDSGYRNLWPAYTVVITLDKPYNGATTVLYTHLKEASPLKVGDKIKAGDGVGLMGTTGCSTGSHLHIEFTRGSGVDPRSVFGNSF